jgi:hypothetical protein
VKKVSFTIIYLFVTFKLIGQVNLSQGLVGCFPFNGNFLNQINTSQTVTNVGAVLFNDRFGNVNSASHFNGTSDFISIGLLEDYLPSGDDFSVSVWIRANQVKLQTILMTNPDDFNDRFNLMTYYDHNGTSYAFLDYGDCTANGRLGVVNQQFSSNWEHYVFVVSATTNSMVVYRDNMFYGGQFNHSSVLNRNKELRIGGAFDANNAPFFFDGEIDDMYIYNRVLNLSEISALFNGQHPCLNTGINSLSEVQPYHVYENTNEQLIVQVPFKRDNFLFRVYNPLGELVVEKYLNDTQTILDTGLSQGVYSCVFTTEKEEVVKKIVIK